MKLLSIILWILSSYIQTQPKVYDIVGTWQKKSPIKSDALLETYSFFPDGTFKYHFNRYNEWSRILSIHGDYKIVRDTLFFLVKERKERVGGEIHKGNIENIILDWYLTDDSVVTYAQTSSQWEYAVFKKGKDTVNLNGEKVNSLVIDYARYFRISKDPYYPNE